MEQNEDLARLEQFVEKLIDNHNQLKRENGEMLAQLQAKEQEIAELQEKMKNLQEDRGVMHNRVSGLIERIEKWEKAIDTDDPGSNPAKSGTQNLTKKTSSLFNVTTEKSPESTV